MLTSVSVSWDFLLPFIYYLFSFSAFAKEVLPYYCQIKWNFERKNKKKNREREREKRGKMETELSLKERRLTKRFFAWKIHLVSAVKISQAVLITNPSLLELMQSRWGTIKTSAMWSIRRMPGFSLGEKRLYRSLSISNYIENRKGEGKS